jgi:hypothetical protein
MSKNTEEDNLSKQVRETMLLKETDELLEIWWKHDQEEWTETALEVVHKILLERLGKIPRKKTEKVTQTSQANVSLPKSKLLIILSWTNSFSWVVLGFYLLVFSGRVGLEIIGSQGMTVSLAQILNWFTLLATPITGLVFFFILQAISEGGQVLIELKNRKQ